MTDYTDIEYLRNNIIKALLKECPVKRDNPAGCQFYELRKFSEQGKTTVLNSFTDQKCLDVYKKHQNCLSRKLHLINNGKDK